MEVGLRIGRREKIWIGVGCAVLMVALAYAVIIYPAFQRMERLDRIIKSQRASLEQILTLRDEWLQIQAERDIMNRQLGTRGTDFSMFRYLESVARQAGRRIPDPVYETFAFQRFELGWRTRSERARGEALRSRAWIACAVSVPH